MYLITFYYAKGGKRIMVVQVEEQGYEIGETIK